MIGIEEGGGGRLRWYCAFIRWPRVRGMQYHEYIGRKGSYRHAKEEAERYVEKNFHIWVLGLEAGNRPPQLGVDIPHPTLGRVIVEEE